MTNGACAGVPWLGSDRVCSRSCSRGLSALPRKGRGHRGIDGWQAEVPVRVEGGVELCLSFPRVAAARGIGFVLMTLTLAPALRLVLHPLPVRERDHGGEVPGKLCTSEVVRSAAR